MTTATDLAGELLDAYAEQHLVAPPSSREGGLDLATAYETEAEIVRRRVAAGHRPVGLKVGFANKAAWRLHKLETLVWAHMYDDTVQRTVADRAELPVGRFVAPKIEPEIVLCVNGTPAEGADAAGVLEAVEWIALGFEIIDCVYQDWKFQPADFVASYGLHAALIVGAPLAVDAATAPALADALASFKLQLLRNSEPAEQGGGRNSLRNPALCVAELASAIARRPGAEPLAAGELISSGTLTESRLIAPGETWTATVDGLALPALTLNVS
jgi:2-oxo-3-hexenedioate decarboxylase